MEADLGPKKRCGKKNLVGILSFSSGKVILKLLIEVLIFYVRFTTVYIRGTSFEKLVLRLLKGDKSSSLQNSLKNLLQVLLSIFGDWECNGKNDSDRKICL